MSTRLRSVVTAAVTTAALLTLATPALAATPAPRTPSPTAVAATATQDASVSWSRVYRHDFTNLNDVRAFTSPATLNSRLRRNDTNQSLLQKPTIASNVGIVPDSGADDGNALAVSTQVSTYRTATGMRTGWTNGRMMLVGHDQRPPVRIRARLRFTPSAHTKTAVMWWPADGGWKWEVDFAETFGGRTEHDYWGSRAHVSERWHGDVNHDGRAREQLIHNVTINPATYHVYDLFVTPSRMWITVDGVPAFQTSDRRYIPNSAGFFSIGKAVTDRRDSGGRTKDTVFVDYLEIYKPSPGVRSSRAVAAQDFNGDGSSDLAVWRPSTGYWYVRNVATIRWGAAGDVPLSGDYNGDRRTDPTVWRPSTGYWYIDGLPPVSWGRPGDVPVNGDFLGAGRSTPTVWRPSTGYWYVRGATPTHWGLKGDIAVPADYNGDGRADVAVWRPSTGNWNIRGIATTHWGLPGDVPVVGDYNGDGRADVVVWRPSTGYWYVRGVATTHWGQSSDVPVMQ